MKLKINDFENKFRNKCGVYSFKDIIQKINNNSKILINIFYI